MNMNCLLVRCTAFSRNLLFLTLIAIPATCISSQQPPPANYDEAKAGTYTLPDPLRFNDGTTVKTANDWTNAAAQRS